ncbi:MAG: hypothetical protein IVW57_11795 [Ktedonobacterales bacterium]|nr:hypothetical protein [Ktedonobacterales bacterium]
MARSLYRLYLYLVFSVLILFTAGGATALLGDLFERTGLRDPASGAPSSSATLQTAAFGATALLIAGALTSLHYWLIQRDLRSDVEAGSGAIRAFFLNGLQAITVLVAIPTAASTISSLGRPYRGDAATPMALAIVALSVFALVEWERRRVPAAPGTALVFQRLQHYGVQLLLLFIATSYALSALLATLEAVLTSTSSYRSCTAQAAQYGCSGPNLPGSWGALLVATLGVVGYVLLARDDTHSTLRQVARFASLGYGVIFIVGAIYQLADQVLNGFNTPHAQAGDLDRYTFLAPLLFGIAVAAAYGLWLRADALASSMGAANTLTTMIAIPAAVTAVPFWWGCGYVLHNLVERVVAGGTPPTRTQWSTSFALVIAGIAYVPLALYLAQLSHQTAAPGPRRALTLGLLAAGTITGAVGAATALYAVGTAVLNAPLGNWQMVARDGVEILVIGAILVGLYGTISVREHYLKMAPTAAKAPTPVAAPGTIEDVLDALLARQLTREEAAARLRALARLES